MKVILMNDIIMYVFAWLGFAIVHSVLANPKVKNFLKPYFKYTYRLFYNLVSIIHITIIYVYGLTLFEGHIPFLYADSFKYVQNLFLVLGFLFLVLALKQYDLGLFSGLKQLKVKNYTESDEEREPFNASGLNAYVRHPLYLASFTILWGRVANEFDLWTAIMGSLYLIVGSKFEERSLVKLYGSVYIDYQKKVPAFIPYKGRIRF